MRLRFGTLIISVAFSCTLTAGTIYTWTDSEGIKHYSDKPPQGDERAVVKGDIKSGELKVDKFNTMSTYKPPTTGSSMSREEAKGVMTSGEIVAPPSSQ